MKNSNELSEIQGLKGEITGLQIERSREQFRQLNEDAKDSRIKVLKENIKQLEEDIDKEPGRIGAERDDHFGKVKDEMINRLNMMKEILIDFEELKGEDSDIDSTSDSISDQITDTINIKN